MWGQSHPPLALALQAAVFILSNGQDERAVTWRKPPSEQRAGMRLPLVNTGVDMIEQIKTVILSHGSMAVIAVIGVVALVLAFKFAHFIGRLVLGLIALAAIGGAVWWFLLR